MTPRAARTRALGAAALAGLLMLSAAPRSLAQPAVAVAPADRDAYMNQVDAAMQRWDMRMQGIAEKAKATDQAAATAAETDLAAAWSRSKACVATLGTATTAEWSEAKSAYEQASQNLTRAWDKTRL